jgi:hypothetical protein
MEFPTHLELLNPLLRAMRDLGGSGSIDEIDKTVAQLEGFPEELREKLHSPGKEDKRTELSYRLAWSRTYLKNYGVLEKSGRAVWTLTSKANDFVELDPQEVARVARAKKKQNWVEFVYWADRLTEHDNYGEERTYKLEIAAHLGEVKESVISGRDDWLEHLDRAFGPPNNLISWRQHTIFRNWAAKQPSDAMKLLNAAWKGDGDFEERLALFCAALPRDLKTGKGAKALSGNGTRTSLASFFLLAVDPEGCPFYKPRAYGSAMSLVGYPSDISKQSDERNTYRHAVGFLDRFIAEAQELEFRIQDRLDAQGLLWLFSNKDLPPSWSDTDRDSFQKYRGNTSEKTGNAKEKAWIFQGNPNRFSLDEHLRQQTYVYWSAPTHRERFSVGDRAFIWRAGTQAGVMAVGRIQELPTARKDVEYPELLGEDLWTSDADDPSEFKVGIEVEEARFTYEQGMISRQVLKDDPRFNQAAIIRAPQGTVFTVDDGERGVLETLWSKQKPRTLPGKSLTDLGRELFLKPQDYLSRITRLLTDKRQVIFQGPPGTGKTYIARKLAAYLAGSPERVRIVQFHPSYAYEDFVEGYRPQLVEGQPGFNLVEGPLRRIAREATANPRDTYILIIDEINRGNVAKVFGELYFLLEYRDEQIQLQYSEKQMALPTNLWLIGTMNTADRSIALVDAALRRRFHFISFSPSDPPIDGMLRRWLEQKCPDYDWVADVVDRANELIEDPHAAIGPSHFMRTDLTDAWVREIWEHSVLPSLEEQFFGETDRLKEFDLDRLRPAMVDEVLGDEMDAPMGLAKVTKEGVEKAIAEFDEIGREAFLEKYGFGKAKSYFLLRENKRYDSKAIVGVAHGHSGEDLDPLTNHDFSGGESTVVPCLQNLGFTVETNDSTDAD